MRTVFLLSVVIFFSPIASAQTATPDSCEQAPKDAVVKLEQPYATWFAIECNDKRKAHFLAPAQGYKWSESDTGVPYKFNAYGPISPSPSPSDMGKDEPHKYYFVKAVPSVMTEQQLAGVNSLLPRGTKPYKTINQLDLNTSTGNIYSFFIYLENFSPEWIVSCVNYQCGTRAILKVSKD